MTGRRGWFVTVGKDSNSCGPMLRKVGCLSRDMPHILLHMRCSHVIFDVT